LIFDADHFLKEANRVLKPGGSAIFTVPFIWDEHEQPFDYARYSCFGLKYLFESHGFEIIESKKLLCDIRLIFLLINAYIYKIIKRMISSRLSLILILPLTSLFNLLGLLFFFFPKNNDLYFGNIILLKKRDQE
jgi:SAM-dependent methyltransferase